MGRADRAKVRLSKQEDHGSMTARDKYRRFNRLEQERLTILRDDPEAIVSGRIRAYDKVISQLEGELPYFRRDLSVEGA